MSSDFPQHRDHRMLPTGIRRQRYKDSCVKEFESCHNESERHSNVGVQIYKSVLSDNWDKVDKLRCLYLWSPHASTHQMSPETWGAEEEGQGHQGGETGDNIQKTEQGSVILSRVSRFQESVRFIGQLKGFRESIGEGLIANQGNRCLVDNQSYSGVFNL